MPKLGKVKLNLGKNNFFLPIFTHCSYFLDPHILPSLIHIACGCQKQKSELPLVRGILADLNVLYKDIIKSISSCLEVR